MTEALAERVLSLPMYPELPIEHVERVAEIVSRLVGDGPGSGDRMAQA